MNTIKCYSVVVAAVLIASMSIDVGATATTQFASGSDGWVGGGGSAAGVWKSSGGVDDSGYFQTTDVAGGQMTAVGPALGNQVSTLGGRLSFDYNVFSLGAANRYIGNGNFGLVTLSSGNFFVVADVIPDVVSNIAGSGWHTASLDLVDGFWRGNTTLATVLLNVTQISVVTEYDYTQRWPDEVVGLDNFRLQAAASVPTALPEPSTTALLFGGLIVAFRLRGRARKRFRKAQCLRNCQQI